MVLDLKNKTLEKISQYWPDQDSREILQILQAYGTEKYHREKDRVRLAVIKLSAGDLDQLEYFLGIARSDYRDVLAWAEYPEEMLLGQTAKKKLPPEQVKALRHRDRQQYLDWLNEHHEKHS